MYNLGGDVFNDSQPGNNSITELHGILIHTAAGGFLGPDPDTANLVNIRHWEMSGTVDAGWSTTNVVALTNDPVADAAAGDFTPLNIETIGQNTKHPAYQTFEDMYGLDIYKDRNGITRNPTAPTVGAVEAVL